MSKKSKFIVIVVAYVLALLPVWTIKKVYREQSYAEAFENTAPYAVLFLLFIVFLLSYNYFKNRKQTNN